MKLHTVILIIACILGLSLLLYPTVSDYWNSNYATHAITSYITDLSSLREEEYLKIWNSGVEYNRKLAALSDQVYGITDEMNQEYYATLDVSGTGIMGYIDIPKISVSLPVYHGTSDSTLLNSIGHIDWSSLPTGGASTHCVVSGHRGLASAKLFTDLDSLVEGDTFMLNILNETLTYEVDQIRIVLPYELDELKITEGMDYCTLVTCTPYGINTHRLLVRGHRVENEKAAVRIISEAVLIDELIVAGFLAVPILFLLLMAILLKKPEKKKKRDYRDIPKLKKNGGRSDENRI